MRLGLAFRVFFAALFNAAVASRLEQALLGKVPEVQGESKGAEPVVAAAAKSAVKPAATKPARAARSEALTLLAALQREARWLDLVQEPLAAYSDAQVGAAARDVLRNCATVLQRFFGLQPVLSQEEGSGVEVPRGYDPQKFRLVGNVSGEPPFRGQLVHPGWQASKCELPEWSGGADAALIVAPVEVELGGAR